MPETANGAVKMKCCEVRHGNWFLVMLLLTCSGCATFNSTWKATKEPPRDTIEGRWDGSWRSGVNGHTGRLRCILSKLDDGTYRAWFHARYWKVLQFGHKTVFHVEKTGHVYRVEGDAPLRWWAGGRYEYAGHITATNFLSTYRSRYDHGIFLMERGRP